MYIDQSLFKQKSAVNETVIQSCHWLNTSALGNKRDVYSPE